MQYSQWQLASERRVHGTAPHQSTCSVTSRVARKPLYTNIHKHTECVAISDAGAKDSAGNLAARSAVTKETDNTHTRT